VRDHSTFSDLIGFDADELDDGTFLLELKLQPHLYQDDGTIHPGVFSTMLDIVMGATVSRKFRSFATTINLNVSYFNLSPHNLFKAETTIIHQDESYVTAEGVIVNQLGEVVSKGIGTFKIKLKEKVMI
jgi:uncharacterized protein (TIGR00369 family)